MAGPNDLQREPAAAPPIRCPKLTADYALWLVPSPEEAQHLGSLIRGTATDNPDCPEFAPHITLLYPVWRELPLEDITNRIRQAIKAAAVDARLEVDLRPAQSGSKYYQSVLAPVIATPQLTALRRHIEEAFPTPVLPPYFPHLSLLYGDLSPEKRDAIAAGINNSQALLSHLSLTSIVVVDCRGSPPEWTVVATVDL